VTAAYLKSRKGIQGSWSKEIDTLFDKWDCDGSPGAIIAVQHRGQVVHQRGYGVANIEEDIPFYADTVLRLGSTSKHFCATCILILENRGLLSLEDDIRLHVPEAPDFGIPITLWHLLTMTSGLWDGVNVPLFAGINTDFRFSRGQLLKLGLSQRNLMFNPGDDHTYSNTNYSLLSLVIERISGNSIADFMMAEIFEPLGMADTVLTPWMDVITPHKAKGYNPAGDGSFTAGYMLMELCGDGGIDSTITDMLKWLDNYRDDRLFGPEYRNRLEAENRLSDGRLMKYRLGIESSQYRGSTKIHHAGGMPGYLCDFVLFPEEDLGIVLLSNLCDPVLLTLPDRIADIVLRDSFTESAESSTISTGKADMAALIGVYVSQEAGQVAELADLDGKLVCFVLGELNPLIERDGVLISTKSLISLRPGAAKRAGRPVMKLIQGCLPEIALHPVDHPLESPLALPENSESYAGLYHDPVTDARHVVTLEDGVLTVTLAAPMLDLAWRVLTPLGGDLFAGLVDGEPSCTNVIARFTRDETGVIDGLDYSINRCRNVIFNRIDTD
jgi:CubicO group peptidase (beta-lactamase class C family)